MFVCALCIELFLPQCHSLKEKRATITPIIEGLRNRFRVASAETDHQDLWQRCQIGVANVGSSVSHVQNVLEECERFVWSFPEVEVSQISWEWLD